MSARTSQSDRYKLKTTFDDDNNTIHTTPAQSFTEGQEVVEIQTKWRRKNDIGVGGFGVVWLEEEEGGGQLRAVKRLPRAAADVGWLRELDILAELRNHQNLFVQFHGWYEDKGFVFFAMEYIEHGDLGQYLKDFGSQAKSQAKNIVTQVLEGLVILHSQNICHRDIKPKNILIASVSPIHVKIADFGLSKKENNSSLKTDCGSSGYLAPELQGLMPRRSKNKKSYTNLVDIWSMGILTYEILTLEIPFLQLEVSDSESESGLRLASGREKGLESRTIDMHLFSDYCRGRRSFPTESLRRSKVSGEGIEFVMALLVADPRSRISAAEALNNPWLLNKTQEPYELEGRGEPHEHTAMREKQLEHAAILPLPLSFNKAGDTLEQMILSPEVSTLASGLLEVWEGEQLESEQLEKEWADRERLGKEWPKELLLKGGGGQLRQDKPSDHYKTPREELPSYTSATPDYQPELFILPNSNSATASSPMHEQIHNPVPNCDQRPQPEDLVISQQTLIDYPKTHQVFGQPIGVLYMRDGAVVPNIVKQCIKAIDLYGLGAEEIYRLGGKEENIKILVQTFDNNPAFCFNEPGDFLYDIWPVASILKKFFRDLPDPLLTNLLYKEFIAASRIDDDITRRDRLHELINTLPDPNYATLRVVTLHLNRVQGRHDFYELNSGSLAIIFGPIFMGLDTADMSWQIKVMDTILQNSFSIFDDGDDDDDR